MTLKDLADIINKQSKKFQNADLIFNGKEVVSVAILHSPRQDGGPKAEGVTIEFNTNAGE